MQGTNPLTMQCIYSTPCGWCTKWDKTCDKKIANTNFNKYSTSAHKAWGDDTYMCEACNEQNGYQHFQAEL